VSRTRFQCGIKQPSGGAKENRQKPLQFLRRKVCENIPQINRPIRLEAYSGRSIYVTLRLASGVSRLLIGNATTDELARTLSLPPKVLEPCRCEFGVFHGVLDRAVA
jgi:hypothetical protein